VPQRFVPTALVIWLTVGVVAFADATDRQTHRLALPAGRTISIKITVGSVRIEGSARQDASIDIVRTAPTLGGLARVPVTIQESDLEVRIDAAQVEGRADPAFRTDVTLHVPTAAVMKSVRILEGRLTLTGLGGEVNADVRRGPIEATDVHGIVRLETGIGHVIANRMTLSADGLLRLRTFNGDVRLTLAQRPTDARLLVLALNGTISSDIPLHTKDTWGPRWGEATLGKGEPVISIDVVTGTIDIKVGG